MLFVNSHLQLIAVVSNYLEMDIDFFCWRQRRPRPLQLFKVYNERFLPQGKAMVY